MAKCRYTGKALDIHDMIVPDSYKTNQLYYYEPNKIYWYKNQHGYLHILILTRIKTGFDTKYAAVDNLLTKDGMLKEYGIYYMAATAELLLKKLNEDTKGE